MLGADFSLNTQEHKDMFVLMCNKLCGQLLRANMLQPISANIYSLLLQKFEFDPQQINKLQTELIQRTIFKQIALMAAETVCHTFQS